MLQRPIRRNFRLMTLSVEICVTASAVAGDAGVCDKVKRTTNNNNDRASAPNTERGRR